MDPEQKLNRLGQSQRNFRYPTEVAQEGVSHFMLIKELKFNKPKRNDDPIINREVKDGLTNFNEFIGASGENGLYSLVRSFALYLPPGAIKTSYQAEHDEVDIGFFGEVFSQNVQEFTEDLSTSFDQFRQSDATASDTLDFYRNVSDVPNRLANQGIDQIVGVGKDLANNGLASQNQGVQFLKQNVLSAIGGLASLASPGKTSGEQIASISMKKTRNRFASLIFTGIKKLRQHNFTFEFYPKNAQESQNIQSIIKSLKLGMLPSLKKFNGSDQITFNYKTKQDDTIDSDHLKNSPLQPDPSPAQKQKTYDVSNGMNSLFFDYPNVYTITFYDTSGENTGNPYLYKIGQSVLESLKVKYNQNYFSENGAPTGINLQLSFKENFALNRQLVESGY